MKTLKTKRELQTKIGGRTVFIIIAAFWILAGLSSCTIEKRLYRPGLHIEFKNHKTQVYKKAAIITEPIANKNDVPHHLSSKSEPGIPEYPSLPANPGSTIAVEEQKTPVNKILSSFTKSISNDETAPDKQEREQVKQERTSRILLNCLIAGFVILFTYLEIWVPAMALCLLLLLLIHCRPEPLTTVRKKAARYKASQEKKPLPEPNYSHKPSQEYYSDKRRVHAGAVLCLPFVLFPPLSFIGLVIGSVALSDINEKPSKYKGKVSATVGVVLNAIWTALMLAIVIAIFML